VLHIALALYMIAFSLGVAALVLSFIANARYHRTTFKGLALILSAMLLILVIDILKVYDRLTDVDFSALQPYVYSAIPAFSYGVLAYLVPFLCCKIINRPVTIFRHVIYVLIAVVVAALGMLQGVAPGNITLTAAVLGRVGVQAYAVWLVLPRLNGIANPPFRSLIRNFTIFFMAGIAATCVESVFRLLPGMPPIIRELSVVELLYCLVAGTLLLGYAFRHLFMIEGNSTVMLPESFTKKFGISPRERQIVFMMIQGYSNRRIGEELFISSMTVKNHIYHIYRKTGVENKVQLVNLINPPK
jgi:DNA-binding CsgD family transcriptional regulator